MSKVSRSKSPKEVRKMLLADGWIERGGKGDHVNFKKPGNPSLITLDVGVRELPIGTLHSIYRKAGWAW
ncbi:MAG: addiction module toxin, HicA family [Rhizobiales bacterium]|nr:addiction module toxin, HicA family [Hyphomicrobiales bacterium]